MNNRLEKYAELIVKSGCNLQKDQILFISSPIGIVEFTRMVAKVAYEAGAKKVVTNFYDDQLSRYAYDYCDISVFENCEEWIALRQNSYAERNAAFLTLLSNDPDIMKGIDQKKVIASSVASHKACKTFYDALDFGKCVWCIAGVASEPWATKVFPELEPKEASEKLMNAILDVCRITNDPIAEWQKHKENFAQRKKWLNSQKFKELHYTASNGTNLIIGLCDMGLWEGGGQKAADGRYFFPNIPTEEIFTTPHRLKTQGIVYSALPLVHNGSRVEDFWIRFEDGRAIDFDAKSGKDVLEGIIKTDENSAYLGECALVPYSSPIRQSGFLFLETLYDENASCHLALGKGFPDCYENGYELNNEKLIEAGVNDSATHVDFMIGTQDLNIDGIKEDGSTLAIFKDGNWAF
ncbi:MAG: aminopeptidase [Coriobacteriales bacterium]|nr:aminopeptidase [Coriobacteriales bacterium]